MMRATGLDEHPNHDAKKPGELGHWCKVLRFVGLTLEFSARRRQSAATKSLDIFTHETDIDFSLDVLPFL